MAIHGDDRLAIACIRSGVLQKSSQKQRGEESAGAGTAARKTIGCPADDNILPNDPGTDGQIGTA